MVYNAFFSNNKENEQTMSNLNDSSSINELSNFSSESFCIDNITWNISNLNYMSKMFKGCYSLKSLSGLSKWNKRI